MRPALAALLLLFCGRAWAGKPTLELELDPYYSDLDYTIPFSSGPKAAAAEQGELKTYRDMTARNLIPRFAVLEASVNPLPIGGVIFRNNEDRLYRRSKVTPSLNLVEAMTSGFEEPYAFSLFLGNVIDFAPGEQTLRRRRKGFVGYLASFGNYHIMESLMVPDNWFEVEAKVKGDILTEARRMSWSFRFGDKSHANREIADVFYFGLRRDRIDYEKTYLSALLSSGIDYRADFRQSDFRPIGHYVMLEKNFPQKRYTFSLGLGYQWLSKEKYSGNLASRRLRPESRVMIRPNVKF